MNHLASGWLRAVALAASAFASTACSAIPELRFEQDPDAAADGGGGGGDAATPSAQDAGVADASDAGVAAGPLGGCPSVEPDGGICCGSTPCLKCTTQRDCTDCLAQECRTGEICCRRGNETQCRQAVSCN